MKLNKKVSFRPSFSMIELIIVIVIIGILAFVLNFSFQRNYLQEAADEIVTNIRFTQSLALKDDKYQPFPINNTTAEIDRSKYWFKQWWQIRFSQNNNGDYFYEIFSDSPGAGSASGVFDKIGNPVSEFAKDPLTGKYMTGNYSAKTDQDLNLSKYNIKLMKFNGKIVNGSHPFRLVFDNFGHVFLDEGISGNAGDTNPLDSNARPVMTKNATIQLCEDLQCNKCIQINVTPSGFAYISSCQ
jgi:prepilin-type N-terminal cleavage/methylation domain-containing protein